MKSSGELETDAQFNRLNDTYFKSVLASTERKHITIAFLDALMSHACSGDFPEIEDVEFLDREFVSKWEGAKVPRFDVFSRAVFKDRAIEGKLFHIEVQDDRDKFFLKRSFYYACNDYAGQSIRGLSYEKFEPVVFLGLLNFGLEAEAEGEQEWYNLHKVLNVATHECSIGLMELNFAELPLLRQKWRKLKHRPLTKFEELMFYFGRVGGKRMGDTLVQEIAERNPVVAELLDYEQEFRRDPLLWRQYLMDERAHFDYLANLEYERGEGIDIGREEGIEEGIEIGREEGINIGRAEGIGIRNIEIAQKARAEGFMTDEQIAELVGLPVNVVREL